MKLLVIHLYILFLAFVINSLRNYTQWDLILEQKCARHAAELAVGPASLPEAGFLRQISVNITGRMRTC